MNDSNWYDYENKKWANAITKDGSMWVWIPRYAYKITKGYHDSVTGEIEIKFLIGSTNLSQNDTNIYSTNYKAFENDTSKNYFLHPAFDFNGRHLGFWVAKFEASVANQSNSCYTNPNENNCNIDNLIPKIIPNATSWRYINTKNAFNVSLKMKNNTSIYGWIPEEVDTHLIKNTEWGAIAYLSKSKYGSHNEEIWNNSYTGYKTGCSSSNVNASNETMCYAYNDVNNNGPKASTTHNIYGIYDMSGGAWERVMATYNNLNGSSGFSLNEIKNIDSKYIDRYITSEEYLLNGMGLDYDNNIYGDAFFETSKDIARYNGSKWIGNIAGSWYNDGSYIAYIDSPFISRGGSYVNATNSGIFYINYTSGAPMENFTFRPVVFVEYN